MERANRSFKRVLIRLVQARPNASWSDTIHTVTALLNNRYHRTIGMKPNEVAGRWKEVYEKNKKLDPRMPFDQYLQEQERIARGGAVRERGETFRLGDTVLVPLPKSVLEKESDRTFGFHLYTIRHIWDEQSPFLYEVEDSLGQKVKRRYYAAEMRKVKPPTHYPVKSVLKTKMVGRQKFVKVSFLDYNDQRFDEWVPAKDLK